MARKLSSLKQVGFVFSLLFILCFATIRANLSTATAEPENNMNIKDTQITLKKTINDLVQRTEELEKRSIQQEEKFKELKASLPRSFFGKKLDGVSTSNIKELDKLDIEGKGLPIAFYLMPADKQPQTWSEHANIQNRYEGGAGAAFRVIRTHDNERTIVASVSWHDGHGGVKNFPGAMFLGIDESPKDGKAVYSLEMSPVSGTVTLINAKFSAFELPKKDVN